jgi:hypothetical protein
MRFAAGSIRREVGRRLPSAFGRGTACFAPNGLEKRCERWVRVIVTPHQGERYLGRRRGERSANRAREPGSCQGHRYERYAETARHEARDRGEFERLHDAGREARFVASMNDLVVQTRCDRAWKEDPRLMASASSASFG